MVTEKITSEKFKSIIEKSTAKGVREGIKKGKKTKSKINFGKVKFGSRRKVKKILKKPNIHLKVNTQAERVEQVLHDPNRFFGKSEGRDGSGAYDKAYEGEDKRRFFFK